MIVNQCITGQDKKAYELKLGENFTSTIGSVFGTFTVPSSHIGLYAIVYSPCVDIDIPLHAWFFIFIIFQVFIRLGVILILLLFSI